MDRSSRDDILRLADALHGAAAMFKIGVQAFTANGPSIVRELINRHEKVFLDLKIHDIPNTARHAMAEVAALGASMTTVHAAGGEAMLQAAATPDVLVLAVTVLTSMDDKELRRIGMSDTVVQNAVRLAALAKQCGLRGVVASGEEIAAIRQQCGNDLVIVVPGVRPNGSDPADQRRTKTPAAAIAAGADYIVVGRPITDAPEPRSAALAIIDSLG
jgi:orotidine-5'-phosphate decarboxylase